MFDFNLNKKPGPKKTYVASKNPLVQSVVVQPRSVRMLVQFEEFLKENVRWVKSMLSDSNDNRTFIEETCVFLRMEPLSGTAEDKHILALKVSPDGYQVNFYEHVPESEGLFGKDEAHWEIVNVVYFRTEDLHLATEHFMKRWRSINPSSTTV